MRHPEPNNLFDLFELPYEGPIWKWAEENIIIPDSIPTDFKGPYRSDVAIYTRDIMDLFQDPNYNEYVIEKGAQVMITTAVYIWLMARCRLYPGPSLVTYSTEDVARSQAETIFMPIFEASPGTAPLIPIHNRKGKWTKLQQQIKTCVLNWTGSNSPAQIASRGRQVVIMDEVDKWPAQSKGESDPVNLVKQRTKTFALTKKIIMLSTPTTSANHIHSHFTPTDRRMFYVPCPHCGLSQVLTWPQVRGTYGFFDSKHTIDDNAKGAYYECAGCKGKITHEAKCDILNRRVLKATRTGTDPRVVGIHVSSLYSPIVTWDYLVRKFLTTKNDPKQLQDFINSELGEPFDPVDARIFDETIADREGEYQDGRDWAESPNYKERFKDLVRNQDYATIIGVDVMRGYIRVVARTFLRNGDSAQVYRAELAGFDALLKLSDSLKAEYIGIDTLYRGSEVLEFCYENPGFYPIHGVTTRNVPLVKLEAGYDIDEGKRRVSPQARTLDRLAIHSDQAFDVLANCIQQAKDKDGNPLAPQWFVGKGVGSDRQYCREMTANVRQGGKWVNPQQRDDHYADCEKICIAMAYHFGYFNLLTDGEESEGAHE